MSLTYKLFFSVLISIIISFGLFSIVVIKIEKDKTNDTFYSKIKHDKEIYSRAISLLLYTVNEDLIKSIINSISKEQDIIQIELIDNANFINIKTNKKEYKNPILVKSVIDLKYNDEDLGKLIIYYSKHFIVEHLQKYKIIIFTFAILLTSLLGFVIYFFINRISSSIKSLTKASTKIAHGDLSEKINIDRDDEIGKLSKQFETMRKALITREEDNIKQLKEIKEKDLMLVQQTKMAAMGRLLENIAHQWRQPLSIISTAATGAKVQKEINVLTDKQLIATLDTINNSAQYLSQTIEDFRDFFDPRNDKMEEFSISKTINKTIDLINPSFKAKNIEIIKEIEDFSFFSIENEIIQVLINLLNNAKDAFLKVENMDKYIFIKTYKNGNYIIIEIKDNAGGVPEDIINKIFEPYFTTKHQSQGTGVGLYMSQKIIKTRLNGTLIVKNEEFEHNNKLYTGAKFIIKIEEED